VWHVNEGVAGNFLDPIFLEFCALQQWQLGESAAGDRLKYHALDLSKYL